MRLTAVHKSAINLTSTLCLSICLGGCASLPIIGGSPLAPKPTVVEAAPDLQAPSNDTGAWSGYAPQDLPDTDWVASFDDAALTALVNEALLENRNIKAAYARLDAAGTRLKMTCGAVCVTA